MNRFAATAFVIIAVVALAGCRKQGASGSPSAGSAPDGVAATVGGSDITMEELDKAAKGQLQKIETEIYRTKKRALDGLIEERLIEDAAKKRGLSAEKYLAEELDSKVAAPSEEEIKALYDTSKDRLKKSYDEVKGQIADYLKANRRMRARTDLIKGLKEAADVKINLEPPRIYVDIKDAPTMGEKDAKITIIEFSDYQCPYCKRVRPTIWRLVDEYKGKMSYTFMDFPLNFHKEAKKAHEAAHCAGDEGKYFEFNRKIFDNQTKMGLEDLKKYARDLKLNVSDFEKCLSSDKYAKLVDDFTKAGMYAGVTGTPAFFINGILISGAQPYESFKEIIESELKR